MKRLLLSLFVLITAVGFMDAAEVTIPTNSENGTWVGGEDGYSATIDGYTIAYTRSASNTAVAPSTDHIRVYKFATLSVKSVSGEIITGIVLNCVNNAKYCSDITVDGVTVAANATDFAITWTGSLAEFVAEATNSQLRIKSITITTGQAAAVANPTFTPEEGTYYVAKNVTIACATEGATIYYTTNGDEPTSTSAVYNAPIKVESTTTIKAMASKGSDNSTVVSATYAIGETTPVENIAEFFLTNIGAGKVRTITNPVAVLYQNGQYLFVQDESAAMLIYGNVGRIYKNGDIIPAGIIGKSDIFGGELQFRVVETETFLAPEEGPAIEPIVVKIDVIDAPLFCKLIRVNDAIVDLEEGKTLTDGTGTIDLYDRFKDVALPTDDKSYDVTAIVSRYNDNYQLFPISFTLTNTGVANVDNAASKVVAGYNVINVNAAEDARVTVVNSVGQVLVNKTVSAGVNAIPVSAGFYLVKVGDVVAKVVVR